MQRWVEDARGRDDVRRGGRSRAGDYRKGHMRRTPNPLPQGSRQLCPRSRDRRRAGSRRRATKRWPAGGAIAASDYLPPLQGRRPSTSCGWRKGGIKGRGGGVGDIKWAEGERKGGGAGERRQESGKERESGGYMRAPVFTGKGDHRLGKGWWARPPFPPPSAYPRTQEVVPMYPLPPYPGAPQQVLQLRHPRSI